MEDTAKVILGLTEIQLIIAKRKLIVCENSTKTNRHLHIEMLQVEIDTLVQIIKVGTEAAES